MNITRQDKSDSIGDWNAVIADAQSEITRLRGKIATLQDSIGMFREDRDSGKPLPDGLKRIAQADNQTSDSCHDV